VIRCVRFGLMRALVLVALAATLAAGVARGAPFRGTDCEAEPGPDSGQINCVGTLPSSHSTVALKEFHGSGEHGLAAVIFGLHETKVDITLKGAPAGVAQPARIRRGGCFGTSGLSLGSVVGGRHTAKVDPLPHVSGYSIVIYASATRRAIVACGVIPPHHHAR
jgi:hypothetical protein